MTKNIKLSALRTAILYSVCRSLENFDARTQAAGSHTYNHKPAGPALSRLGLLNQEHNQ